jgi:hypothetical protein
VVEEIGEGSYGTAYDIGKGRVLKITTDEVEAGIANYILSLKKNFKHIAKIYDVFTTKELKRSGYFFIVMKMYEPLDDIDQEEFDEAASIYDNGGDVKEETEGTNATWRRKVRKYYPMVKAIDEECRKVKILAGDIHSGNVGWDKNGNLVLFDIGGSSRGPKSNIDVVNTKGKKA